MPDFSLPGFSRGGKRTFRHNLVRSSGPCLSRRHLVLPVKCSRSRRRVLWVPHDQLPLLSCSDRVPPCAEASARPHDLCFQEHLPGAASTWHFPWKRGCSSQAGRRLVGPFCSHPTALLPPRGASPVPTAAFSPGAPALTVQIKTAILEGAPTVFASAFLLHAAPSRPVTSRPGTEASVASQGQGTRNLTVQVRAQTRSAVLPRE